MRNDEYSEEERHGSTQRTTKMDVDVEDNPPEPKEKGMDFEDDDADFASFEDVTFKRDEQGELVPEDNYVEEIEAWTKALPMTDQQRSHVQDFFQDEDVTELSDAWLADLFESRLVKPDLTEHSQCEDGRVTERFIAENMSEYNQMALLYGILMASDEWDILRMFRNDLTEKEMEMALKLREQQQREDREREQTESKRGNRRGRQR